ncbi:MULTISPECIES: alpha-ketoglutarate-dependent dioxygenase AlkB [unclassified Nocardioides]|uniref:alpha-ketoglutarate-dependent dioxygenase AlkB n=1 Tax=unclassified Nocardioides TaxID=2615069 RepID=UPI0030157149
MPSEHQPSLFASDVPSVDAAFTTARRIVLDEHSWVEVVPGWLSGADALFDDLMTTAGWEQRDRWMYTRRVVEPRLTAQYPRLADAPHLLLHTAAQALSAHYGVTYDGLWINLYRDHRDSTGWHGDGASTRRRECVVPVLTLGAQRRFLLRPVDGGPSTDLRPVAGDLVVMGGRCQTDWRHRVPKQSTPSGPRISVNFSASEQAVPD